ncbi:MAG: hypothetical protein R3E48_17150 [Burkholderiaceae bacterium]
MLWRSWGRLASVTCLGLLGASIALPAVAAILGPGALGDGPAGERGNAGRLPTFAKAAAQRAPVYETRILREVRSTLRVGDKGRFSLDVSRPRPACGAPGLVYDRARIVYRMRRFSEAQIVAAPRPGCSRCGPLEVAWYVEPTGRIDFALEVRWRRINGVCGKAR